MTSVMKKGVTIKEIDDVEDPEIISDNEVSDYASDDVIDSDSDDSNDSNDSNDEQDNDIGSLFQYFFTNDNGENVVDILTGLKDSIDTHNKLLYKLIQKIQ